MHAEGPHLVRHQVVHEVLGIDADEQWRELGVHHLPAHGRGAVGVPDRQARQVLAPQIVELVQLPSQPPAGIGRRQGLAKPEVIGAVQGGQDAGGAVDLLEVAEVVPGSQVHAPALVHPAVRFGSGQENHGPGERRADLEHRAVLLREVPEERVQVAVPNMRVAQQPGQRNRRNLPGKGRALKGRAGEVLRDRSGQGAADQVHPADELDALLRLVVELEYETEDVAGIDEADDDDISRIGNLVGEDDPADPRPYELACSALLRLAGQFPMPDGRSQCPEFAVVVFQDLQVNQAVENRIDDRLRAGSEPFDPVLGVVLPWCVRDFLEDGIQGGVAGFCRVHEEQGLHVRVDAGSERKLREHGAGHGAVQMPAGYLVKVAGLLVEEHQDEFLSQSQRLGQTLGSISHQPSPPCIMNCITRCRRRNGAAKQSGADGWCKARERPSSV